MGKGIAPSRQLTSSLFFYVPKSTPTASIEYSLLFRSASSYSLTVVFTTAIFPPYSIGAYRYRLAFNPVLSLLGFNSNSQGVSYLEFAEIEQPFKNGDIYLLSSDGLHDIVSVGDIWDTLLLPDAEGPQAEKLMTLAKEAGGKDNISIVTVKVQMNNEQ
jgi:serine/threonine protein phosphatase PrpC